MDSTAEAIPATMAGSDSRLFEEGFMWPTELCTIPIEFSTVTNWFPLTCLSISVLPKHGRISDFFPVTKWLRFNFVDTKTVSSQLFIALAINLVSDIADRKLPPMARNTFPFPSTIARAALTASNP